MIRTHRNFAAIVTIFAMSSTPSVGRKMKLA